MSKLLESIKIGAWNLPNRVVMAPLTRCRASEGRVPNALMAEYYAQRASAGLILSEATSITPQGVGYKDTPGLWSSEQVEGWKTLTDLVHAAGGTIIAQLWHVGRVSHTSYHENDALPVAPSAIAAEGHVRHMRPEVPYETPRALDLEEIPGIIEDYRRAAQNAKDAGFDGVEIHGANGYLPHQFLNDSTNKRQDQYGGSIENRARFMLESLDAAIDIWGADHVGLHISPQSSEEAPNYGDSNPLAAYGYVMEQASQRGIAFVFSREPTSTVPRLSDTLRQQFSGSFIANQELTKESAEALLKANHADAVSFGRTYIANPDLVQRFSQNAELNQPNPDTFYTSGPEGYTDYPTLNV